MAHLNGTVTAVLSGTDKILHGTNATLTTNQNLFDTTDKDDAGWATHGNGLRSWSISGDGVFDTGGSGLTPDEILAAIIARTADTVIKFVTNAPTSTTGWSGNGTFQSVTINGPLEDKVTYSYVITGNGALAAL